MINARSFFAGAIFLLILFTISLLILLDGVKAIGLGVSPPQIHITEEGLGRLVLFNPGNQDLSYSLDLEGDFHARPGKGVIKPLSAAEVLISGQGNGIARIFAESQNQDEPVALPSIEVKIESDEVEASFTKWIWWIGGIGGIVSLLLIAILRLIVTTKSQRSN